VLVTHVVPYSAAATPTSSSATSSPTERADLNTWDQLVSTLYLTPAYTSAETDLRLEDHGAPRECHAGLSSKLVQ